MHTKGYTFVPLSTYTFARLSRPAMALLNKLADCAMAGGVVFKDGFTIRKKLRTFSFPLDCLSFSLSLVLLCCCARC